MPKNEAKELVKPVIAKFKIRKIFVKGNGDVCIVRINKLTSHEVLELTEAKQNDLINSV